MTSTRRDRIASWRYTGGMARAWSFGRDLLTLLRMLFAYLLSRARR